jgi:integrase
LRSTGYRDDEKDGWKNARMWRDKQDRALKAGRAQDIEHDRLLSDVPTLGAVQLLVQEAAQIRRVKHGKPSEKTINNYFGALKSVVELVHGGTWKDYKLDILTDSLAVQYRGRMIHTDADPMLQRRQRRTACSTLHQARAIFGKDFLLYLEKRIRIPDTLAAFLRESAHLERKQKYQIPPQDLLDATLKGFDALKATNPGVYAAFLLGYYLGMRAGEMASARVEWISEVQQDGRTRRFMEIRERSLPEPFKPKGIDHKVPIADEVYAALMQCKAAGPYFLPGTGYTSRHDIVSRDMTTVMRTLGWSHDKYSKGAHELRKLAGSLWYTKYGVGTAALWLGHSDIKTTYDYYSDLSVHPEALGFA